MTETTETIESYSSDGLELTVTAQSPTRLTYAEERVLSRAAEKAWQEVRALQLADDTEQAAIVAEERRRLLALFGSEQVFVEEIPNGYCSQWCCRHRPWYVVTTRIGRITIGWRKQVISICWEKSMVEATAEELFPDEEVTKLGWTIHAWSYEVAGVYVRKLLSAK